MTDPAVITFVTGNQNKLREVSQIISGDAEDHAPNFTVVSKKIDLPELQGEPEDIARQKCALAVDYINGPTVRIPTIPYTYLTTLRLHCDINSNM